jgi:hypothetical protein
VQIARTGAYANVYPGEILRGPGMKGLTFKQAVRLLKK